MVDLDDGVVALREGETNNAYEDSFTRAGNIFRGPEGLGDVPSGVCDPLGNSQVGADGEPIGQPSEGKKEGPLSRQEYLRVRFYKHYQREAEEYDREFMKKYDEDLNTTLIFAGLFSAVTSAFIAVVHSEFQPNLNEETNALLRVMIHQMDNTTFGGQTPTIPQWTGPSHSAVQVQAILFASLCASLLSAFLAMLGKQWLNRCIPVDMRGTIIERGQYRQRKIDGIVNWYFDNVMETLPLMLQVALLLLGCALSRFLWDINTTVASVVIAVTASGLLFYLFIVIAGVASVNCPYQTPGANFLRHIPETLGRVPYILPYIQDLFLSLRDLLQYPPHIFGTLHSAVSTGIKESFFCHVLIDMASECKTAYHSLGDFVGGDCHFVLAQVLLLPIWLIGDICRAVIWLLVGAIHRVRHTKLEPQTEQQQAVVRPLDLRCVLWTLQTSVEGPVRSSALEYLATMTLKDTDPIQIVGGWFDTLINCIEVTGGNAVIVQGTEQLASASPLFCLHTLSHLAVMDPTPKIFRDIRQRYIRKFPPRTDFDSLPFSHTLGVIHSVFHPSTQETIRWRVEWNGFEPSSEVYIATARALTKLAQFGYQRSGRIKVPRLFLRFALHSLSQDPPPPPSVIADSLTIIAIDLECDVSNAAAVEPSDPSTQVGRISGLIIKKLTTLADPRDQNTHCRKRKALTALFPYAAWQERDKQYPVFDILLRVIKSSKSNRVLWRHVGRFLETQLSETGDVSLNRAMILISPHVPWGELIFEGNLGRAWAATVSAIPKEEEFIPSVVDALLQIARFGPLRGCNSNVWSWLALRPSLPPTCAGRVTGSHPGAVRTIRDLKDIEILKSYLFLVWSKWDFLNDGGFNKICDSIREDFGGVDMRLDRVDLMERLDHVLRQLDRGLYYLQRSKPEITERGLQQSKDQYGKLKKILLEVDRKALETLTQSHSTFMCALPLPYP